MKSDEFYDPTHELSSYREFLDQTLDFTASHDRSAVITGTAMIEGYLDDMFEALLFEHKRVEKFGRNGILDSFATKIDWAWSLGLIGDKQFSDLHAIRRIRNRAAHEHGQFSLDHDSVGNLIDNLAARVPLRVITDHVRAASVLTGRRGQLLGVMTLYSTILRHVTDSLRKDREQGFMARRTEVRPPKAGPA